MWESLAVLLLGGFIGFLSRELYWYFFRRLEIVEVNLAEGCKGQAIELDILFRNNSNRTAILHGAELNFEHSENLKLSAYSCSYITIDQVVQARIDSKTKEKFLPLTVCIEPNKPSRIKIYLLSTDVFYTIFNIKFHYNKKGSLLRSENLAGIFYPADHKLGPMPITDSGMKKLSFVSRKTPSMDTIYRETQTFKRGSL